MSFTKVTNNKGADFMCDVCRDADNQDHQARSIKAWENYDLLRSEYKHEHHAWYHARTTESANAKLPDLLKTREAYSAALVELRELGFEPQGEDPLPADHYKKE